MSMSRSEQRQLDAAMAASVVADARKKGSGKEKAEAPPKKKGSAKAATPRGGDKKRASVKKGPGRKRTRKADSDDSSSDSSEDAQDESSSDDEPAVRAAPAKKRAKPAPAAVEDDSDESAFEDEFDDELYKGTEDKQWMQTLNELEREAILSERLEKRQIAKEAWMLQHQKKKQQQAAGPSSSTKDRAAALAQSQPARRQKEPDEKKKLQKAALDDMQARKAAQKLAQTRKETAGDSSDEDEKSKQRDEEAREKEKEDAREQERDREKSRKELKVRHRHDDDEKRREEKLREEFHMSGAKAQMAASVLNEVRISRRRLVEYVRQPFFEDFVTGMFVRVNVKQASKPDDRNCYMVVKVIKVIDGSSEYTLENNVIGREPIACKKKLLCTHAGEKKTFPISLVSNKNFEQNEVDIWAFNMFKSKIPLPDSQDLKELKDLSNRDWKESFKYDNEVVDAMLRDAEKVKKKTVNVALDKMKLQDERDLAWEDYKNTNDDEEKNAAYERWEKLREEVQRLEELEEEQKQKLLQEHVAGIASINSRAVLANRTVTKQFNLKINELSSRPYVRTTYWAISKEGGDDGEDDKQESQDTSKSAANGAPKAATSAAQPVKKPVVISEEELNADDIANGSAEAAPRDRVKAAEAAVARAHKTELAVEVDTSSAAAQAKKPDEPALPVRHVNPLKPITSAAPPTSTNKTALSLEEYKRRRGL